MALVPQVRDRVDVPVIAAGGIMDGRGIAAALDARSRRGADGHGVHRLRGDPAPPDPTSTTLAASADGDTVVTRAFTGRPARALRTGWIDEVESRAASELPPYPVQAMLLAELRAAGLERGELETVMRLAGQGAPMLIRRSPAADLVAELVAETEAALARAASGAGI